MGVTYKATIKIKCWKQHECVGCGGQYRYLFERTVTGEGGNEDAAGHAAEKAAVRAVEKDVDQRPCPRCGCVQPDMIAQKKSNTHFWIALGVLLLSAVLLIFGGVQSATWMPYSLASLVLAGLSGMALLVHALTALGNPNKNKEANKDRAERMIERGEMERVAKGDDDLASGEPKPVAGASFPLLGLGALAVALMAAPFVLKSVSGWPSTPGTKPEVIGPGDTVTAYFPNKINSVKGYWSGNPQVTVVNDGGSGLKGVTATGKSDTWGSSMYVKSSEKSNSANVWAEVKIPNDPNLVGKTVELRVDMDVRYPQASGNTFNDQTAKMSTTVKYTLVGSNAGGMYRMTYWVCVLGAVLFAVAGFGLMGAANGLRKYAAPADVTPIEDKTRRRDDDDEDEGSDDPRRDRRRDRDDEDDRPRNRRDRDRDDDEDDRPRRRDRDRDRDRDEDDRPRRRRYDD